jgi:MoxR-like ATPase
MLESAQANGAGPDVATNHRELSFDQAQELLGALSASIATVLQGKADIIETAVLCLAAEGHLLLDDVPGVGKTVLAKAIAASIGGKSARVQFTPDLLPADITGVSIWQPSTETFSFRPGPIFANVVVCDELNRGPAKTQSALLEAMEERAVTVDRVTTPLARPFIVIATQNPFEQDGTYNLPESQIDRFLMRTSVGYPARDAELGMLATGGADVTLPAVSPVVSTAEMGSLIALANRVYTAPALLAYIVDLTRATREHADVALGASPRAGLSLTRAARAHALLRGRSFATPDDVRAVVHRVLDHRILVRGSIRWDRSSSEAVVDAVLGRIAIPAGRNA